MSQALHKYLNEMLLSEVESMLEFTMQANLPDAAHVRERLQDFAREELEHASMLMGMILRSGGAVSVGRPEVTPPDGLGNFFCRGAAREDDSIRRYTALLELVGTPEDRDLLGKAIAQERTHQLFLEAIRASCEVPGRG